MEYEIKKQMGRWGFLGIYSIFNDGEEVGEIRPLYKTLNSNRAYGYQTNLWFDDGGMSDEDGAPKEFRTVKEARAAVEEFMHDNGYRPAKQ